MQKRTSPGHKLLAHLNNLNIQKKLLWLFTFAFLVPILIIFFFISNWLYSTLSKWQLDQAKSAMAQTATLLGDSISNVENLSDTLYVNRTIRNTLTTQYTSNQEVYERYMLTSFMDDFLQANSDIASIRFYTENPTILDNAYFLKSSRDIKQAEWYSYAKELNGKRFWVVTRDSITKKTMLSLVRSVYDFNSQEFIAVLVINIEYDKISRFIVNQKNPTYIAVDGIINFYSDKEPAEIWPEFLRKTYSFTEIDAMQAKWEGQKSVVLLNQLYRNGTNSIILMQVIPHKVLISKTAQGMAIYVVIMIIAIGISIALILIFSQYFEKRVTYVDSEIQKVVQNNFEIGPKLSGTDELAEIYSALVTMTANIKQLIDEVYQHKIEQAQLLSRQNDIRFKMLSSQINPHFLFNTLETIRMQALSDGNRDVANTIKLLSKILRHNLSVSDRPVPVMEEIDAISNYLDIQHLRFSDRVSYDIIYMCDIRSYGILPLLIQPVVENSFIHGLEARSIGGFIYITIESDGDRNLFIKVRDNGCGMNAETLDALNRKLMTSTVEDFNSSIGMVNVNQRIKLYYGSEYGLTIESEENKGTEVTIHVPLVPLSEKGE